MPKCSHCGVSAPFHELRPQEGGACLECTYRELLRACEQLRFQMDGRTHDADERNTALAERNAEVIALRDELERVKAELSLAKEDAALWRKSEGECCKHYDEQLSELERVKAQNQKMREALKYHAQLGQSWLGLGNDSESLRRILNSAEAALAADAGKEHS